MFLNAEPFLNVYYSGTSNYEILRETFWPGDIIVDQRPTIPRAYRVIDALYYENCWTREFYLHFEAEYFDFDGIQFGTVAETFRIEKFEGVKYIHDLPVFPLKYHADQHAIRKHLLERGRKFVSLKGQNFKTHSGLARTIDDNQVHASI